MTAIVTYDFSTALEIMDRIIDGESLKQASENALATKAAVALDPWHLKPENGARLQGEFRALVARALAKHGVRS